jgi:allantoin racemase
VVGERIPAPLVDQAQAALRQAETLAALGPRKAAAGRFRRPGPKPSTGLRTALARRLAHED